MDVLTHSEHPLRNAVFIAAMAGFAKALQRERNHTRQPVEPPRIGESPLGEPGEVLWYC